MPRIGSRILNSVTFLYSSEVDARRNNPSGGTGFLYGIPVADNSSDYSVFIVTCRHVLQGEDVFVRLNTRSGGHKTLSIPAHDWQTDPTEDIKIAPIAFDPEYQTTFVRSDLDYADDQLISRMNIGPGDDVFVIGRFISHGGRARNNPVVRFGCISMMPNEPVHNEAIGLETLCYLVDLRIRAGFSGSPVFVQYSNRVSVEGSQKSEPWSGERLLGICWGEFITREQIREVPNDTVLSSHDVQIPEGMTCVAPASRIHSLVRDSAA